MKSIIKTSKQGVIVILTLCILLGIFRISMEAENITTVEGAVAVPEEITIVVVEKDTIYTGESAAAIEDTTVVREENPQELMPIMATGCYDPLTSIFGSGYTITSTSGPWQYILGAGGITGAYNTSTRYGYVQMSDGTRVPFQF